jgi:cation diffusion facilitator family transporter
MARASGSRLIVLIALAGNLAIAISKFFAAFLTGSSAMASEGIHSLADTANEVLLLHGMKRADAPPDTRHPFGHGREAYFWSFIVALMIFALGALASFYQGISRLREPHALDHFSTVYAVLAISFVFEGISWIAALRRMRSSKGRRGYYEAIRRSKDPSVFTVLLEDSAALLGLLVALAGTLAAQITGRPEFDACASIVIGVLLCVTSFLLARETKALLIGEPAHTELQHSIRYIASCDPAIAHVNGVITVQLGPNQVFSAISAAFDDALKTPEIEASVDRIEGAIRTAHGDVVAVFVKPQTRAVWRAHRDRLGPASGD